MVGTDEITKTLAYYNLEKLILSTDLISNLVFKIFPAYLSDNMLSVNRNLCRFNTISNFENGRFSKRLYKQILFTSKLKLLIKTKINL